MALAVVVLNFICILTVVISACIKKKNLPKLVNFYVAILILKMEENTQRFQYIMLSFFKKGKNATETQKKICAVYGEGAVIDRTYQDGL